MPDKRLTPSTDPNVPHPGMVFYCRQWHSPEAVARHKAKSPAYNKEQRAAGKRSAHNQRLRAEKKALGICVDCMCRPTRQRVRCDFCAQKESERKALRQRWGIALSEIRLIGLKANFPSTREEDLCKS